MYNSMDKKELEITASLALLELSEEEYDRLGEGVSQMLEYFEKMMEVDVEGLEPTVHALLKNNRVREDVVKESAIADDLLEGAPELEDRFIVIPNVL